MKKIAIISILLTVGIVLQTYGQQTTFFSNATLLVEPLDSVNTASSEISPCFVDDTLYYSSIPFSLWEKSSRVRKNTAYYDLYEYPLTQEGILAEKAESRIVSGFGSAYHEGPVAYCSATGELYVTVSNVALPDTVRMMIPKAEVKLKIIIMTRMNGQWQLVSEMPFNDRRYNFAHPAINGTGDTLVFSSDTEGGLGKSDLYMTVRKNGEWAEPVNLGDKINTPGNEMFPTFIGNGILSFSSDGHPGGFGYMDIWYTVFPNNIKIENAGEAINSHFDEFGLVVNREQTVGYFTSDRPGKGSDDIFRLDIRSKYVLIRGQVVDDQNGQPISGASLQFSDCSGTIISELLANETGKFETEVPINKCLNGQASASEYQKAEKEITGLTYIEYRLKRVSGYEILVLDHESNTPVQDVSIVSGKNTWKTGASGLAVSDLKLILAGKLVLNKEGYLDQTITLPEKLKQGMVRDTVYLYKNDIGKVFVLKNIYYEFDKWDILAESEAELNNLVKIMNDNPTLNVELGSHTDSRGNDDYNRRLAQKRSDSAVNYIVAKGISRARITAKGYGESQLINRCKNGEVCPDWEHRQNRRTEFKILSL